MEEQSNYNQEEEIVPPTAYCEADLVSFGNYLLSEERETGVSETMLRSVTHADLANWKDKQ